MEFLESNPTYAHVRLPGGGVTTVSLDQPASIGETSQPEVSVPETVLNTPDFENSSHCGVEPLSEIPVLPSRVTNESHSPSLLKNEVLP